MQAQQEITARGGERPPSPQVVIGWCHNGEVRGDWAECYAELRLADAHHRRLLDPAQRPLIEKGLYIHRNRNRVCRRFLQRREPWLLFLDTDMLFAPGHFYGLYDQAVRSGIGVHAGLYYGMFDPLTEAQKRVGMMISSTWLKKHGDRVATIGERKGGVRDDLDGCGMGFTLIHRQVLEALAAARPHHANAWFGHDEETDADGTIDDIGEDTSFCTRAKKLGYKIFGHEGIALGHDKRTIITWEHHDWEQARTAA